MCIILIVNFMHCALRGMKNFVFKTTLTRFCSTRIVILNCVENLENDSMLDTDAKGELCHHYIAGETSLARSAYCRVTLFNYRYLSLCVCTYTLRTLLTSFWRRTIFAFCVICYLLSLTRTTRFQTRHSRIILSEKEEKKPDRENGSALARAFFRQVIEDELSP